MVLVICYFLLKVKRAWNEKATVLQECHLSKKMYPNVFAVIWGQQPKDIKVTISPRCLEEDEPEVEDAEVVEKVQALAYHPKRRRTQTNAMETYQQ